MRKQLTIFCKQSPINILVIKCRAIRSQIWLLLIVAAEEIIQTKFTCKSCTSGLNPPGILAPQITK